MNEPLPTAAHRLTTQAHRLAQTDPDSGWLHLAFALTNPPSLFGCADCLTALPDYIETELNQPFNALDPLTNAVRQHLDRCPTCAAAYLDLLETALWAEEGLWPPPPRPLDLTFLPKPPQEDQ